MIMGGSWREREGFFGSDMATDGVWEEILRNAII
jgi:hypothetical protein